jgi:hypothetical protein
MGAAAGFQILGNGLSGMGAIADAGDKTYARYQNIKLLEKKVQYDRLNQLDAVAQGEQDAAAQTRKGSVTVQAQAMAYEASGVDSTVGTPATVAASTRLWSEHSARIARNNAYRKALGFQVQSEEDQAQLDILNQEQDSAPLKNAFNIIGTFLGG